MISFSCFSCLSQDIKNKTLELGKDFLYGGNKVYFRYFWSENLENNQNAFTYSFDKTPLSESTHTKLIPILEKTGAELFGDRFVLMDNTHKTAKYHIKYKEYTTIIPFFDIIKEYSKLLAGENNQFEEFCEKIR